MLKIRKPVIGPKGEHLWTVQDTHAAYHCRDGANCTGPGCNFPRRKASK
jgi:hypothetical protein